MNEVAPYCPFPVYSRAEKIADGAVHIAGVMMALMAVPVLVTLVAVWHGTAGVVTATVIYGLSLISMMAVSACYHMSAPSPLKEILRRMDHSAIYLLIAGTYTPFGVLVGGAAGFWTLVGIWTCAAAGISLKVLAPRRLECFALALYLGMGWAILLFGWPMLSALSSATVTLIAIGGLTYTIGVGFHLAKRMPFHNAIWHGMVLAASGVFSAAVIVETFLRA
ncbi:MAG: hemolysin III family protein [Pseudomonadota bacterium]